MTTVHTSLNGALNKVLIGVVGPSADSAASQAIFSSPQARGETVNDVCCIDLRRKGPTLWRIFTTHASAKVDGGEVNISQGSELPQDGLLISKLKKQRDALLAILTGTGGKEEFPYASIQGKMVVLLGDFSGLPEVLLLALKEIFLANGAKQVDFVELSTPSA